jgi:hypothetical protein
MNASMYSSSSPPAALRALTAAKRLRPTPLHLALPLQAVVDRVPIVLSLLKFDARLLDGRGFVLAYFFQMRSPKSLTAPFSI